MALHNTVLSDTFVVEGSSKVIELLKTADSSTEVVNILDRKAWEQTVGMIAMGGLPSSADEAFKKLEACEIEIRNYFALKSERPGGARSKGTGFKLHPTFKSYKSTIKNALDADVELLDASGMPRSRNDVISDTKDARTEVKSDAEKLTQATATWLAIYGKCDPNDASVLALVKQIIDATTPA
jgi:hypothetical protein